MHVAILGFSVLDQSENLPLYRYFKVKGANITAFYWSGDTVRVGAGDSSVRDAMPDDITKIEVADANAMFDDLESFDLVVRSPIVHPRQIKTTKPVTSLTNIFWKNARHR